MPFTISPPRAESCTIDHIIALPSAIHLWDLEIFSMSPILMGFAFRNVFNLFSRAGLLQHSSQ